MPPIEGIRIASCRACYNGFVLEDNAYEKILMLGGVLLNSTVLGTAVEVKFYDEVLLITSTRCLPQPW